MGTSTIYRVLWTTAYKSTDTAALGPGARSLDGTIAVIHSKAVQVGNHNYQENTIVHTVSPDIAPTVLLENPDVVHGLIDLACSPPGTQAKAKTEFERAVSSALVTDLASSAAARRGHGTVHRTTTALDRSSTEKVTTAGPDHGLRFAR